MRKFVRQKSNGNAARMLIIDFGAAAAKVPQVFEPDEYKLRVQSARVIQSNENILIALDLVELESGGRVDGLPLWVDGPNADAGDLTAENQHLIAQLLTLRSLPTSGNVTKLIENWPGWSSMPGWCSLSTAAAAALTTRSPKSSLLRMRHDLRGATVHVRRRRSASC